MELARRGARAAAVLPGQAEGPTPWPAPGPAAFGAELLHAPGDGASLVLAASAWAARCGPPARTGGLVLAALPEADLEPAALRGVDGLLLRAAVDRAGRRSARDRLVRIAERDGSLALGVVMSGARRVAEAAEAFERLANDVAAASGRAIRSYGLLVDDLALYRSIVDHSPVSVASPRSPAARALADVARLLHEDVLDGSASRP